MCMLGSMKYYAFIKKLFFDKEYGFIMMGKKTKTNNLTLDFTVCIEYKYFYLRCLQLYFKTSKVLVFLETFGDYTDFIPLCSRCLLISKHVPDNCCYYSVCQ